ncbi:asparagine synthase (glutamine-hydrolyzing) [Rhodoplanes elegans]|uniref:asparagine synthase (glutamine-hydrolyzing) n=1 Tax=Rhodoplanes elegans TaxID=29408 RepID=A0A327KPN3_9BRAD|nr:asparagine synthase (glutamine-hydrolyzing) [Rhodoplanes elegans]MBK5957165.1 asparagine synthase (glutamine-hydrolyzing) [Rhodoplanes elegans]RAI40341.1 asparagine synthase (glutamine-hydrolyzing) [Rhodoplanes elegans]
MCGLVGGVWRQPQALAASVATAALGVLTHRGPDAGDQHHEPGVFLGHRRLSIIDLDPRSTQPMHAGPLSIVFNGEIYNYRALRDGLVRRGVVFRTESDTEVLLASFALDGLDCLPRLEGMFSFAIWDRDCRRLTLARDRYGEKPMVYYADADSLLFASEIPPIEVLAGDGLEVDRSALPWLFRFSYLPAPASPYRGMRQLRPAHWLQLDLDHWTTSEGCYYQLPAPPVSRPQAEISFDNAQAELRRRLTASVEQRLAASDVPIATFLSGGLDSSIISAIAAQVCGGKIAAYSVGFPEDPAFDESPFARSLAARYPQIEHHVIEVTEDKLAGFTDRTLAMLGEPYADASLIPTAYLCAHVNEKVILGGDGADEFFAGYGVYSAMLVSARIPSWIKTLAQLVPMHGNPAEIGNNLLRAAAFFRMHLGPTSAAEYLSWRSYATPAQIERLGFARTEAAALPDDFAGLDLATLRDILMMDIRFNLSADMLKKVDLASMQHSLEVRLPFLDSELVAFALGLPETFLISRGTRKHILREAFREQLPEDILGRGKKGFLLPIRKWMKSGRMRDELLDLAHGQSFLDPAAVEQFAGEHRAGRTDQSQLLWACYVLLKWQGRRASFAG